MSFFEAGDVRSMVASDWLHTLYTLYSIHQLQQQPLATFFCKTIKVSPSRRFGAAYICPLLVVCRGAVLLLASTVLKVSRPGMCCVCAEAGASDLHQAHLLPLSPAAAEPALTAKRPPHVVDSHSACHVGCWRRGCSAGSCCHHTCLGQPCRSSNSHSQHYCTARYAASKHANRLWTVSTGHYAVDSCIAWYTKGCAVWQPMCVCVCLRLTISGLIDGWEQTCMWAVSRQKYVMKVCWSLHMLSIS